MGRIVVAEGTVAASEAYLSSLSLYLAPVLDGAAPPSGSGGPSWPTCAPTPSRFLPELRQQRGDLVEVQMAPWDGRLRAVPGPYLHRLDAWLGFIEGTTAEPGLFYADRSEVRDARLEAEQAFRRWNVGTVVMQS